MGGKIQDVFDSSMLKSQHTDPELKISAEIMGFLSPHTLVLSKRRLCLASDDGLSQGSLTCRETRSWANNPITKLDTDKTARSEHKPDSSANRQID